MAVQTKHCGQCNLDKPCEDFHRSRSERDGRQSKCKACQRDNNRARRNGIRTAVLATEPPPPPKPPTDPLESAYAERSRKDALKETSGQRDALLDENKKLKAQIAELVRMKQAPSVLIYQQAKAKRADAVACAIASDWHVEETVEKESVHGLNEYNLDIAKERASRFFRNLLTLTDGVARDSVVRTISLSLLGDFFSGHIHDELKASTALAPGDAAGFAKNLLVAGIEFLLKESKYIIEADCIPGNHGRMTDQVWISDPTGTSLETFMYHAIAGRFDGNPRVRINVAQHAMIYRRHFESFVVRKIHGYEVKYGGGVGGFTIPILKKLAAWDAGVRASYTEMGHFHRRFDGGTFGVNGSLIGFNAYAQSIGASPEAPEQQFYLVHARGGGTKSIVAPIWVTEERKAKAA